MRGPTRRGGRSAQGHYGKSYTRRCPLRPVYSKADLSVFEKLSADQIGELTDVFYEAMVKSTSAEKVREVLGKDVDDEDVGRIVRSFRRFFVGRVGESDLRVLPSLSPADKDKISIVRGAIDKMSSHNGTYDSEAQSRDLARIFKLKPRKGPAPTIKGILSHYESDMDATELIREIRDG